MAFIKHISDNSKGKFYMLRGVGGGGLFGFVQDFVSSPPFFS